MEGISSQLWWWSDSKVIGGDKGSDGKWYSDWERKLEIWVGFKPNKFDPSLSNIKLVRSGAIAKIILQPSQTDTDVEADRHALQY